MSADNYLTIAGPGRAQTRVLGSRFLGAAFPVSDEAEVAACLETERKQYYDATHWCFAFRLGTDAEVIEKASDAGEPHGTAGQPILREIQKRGLTQCLVIVTRYFGGTKLGTGRLARSYAESATLALDAAPEVRKNLFATCRVECPYDLQNTVYLMANRHNASIEAMPEADRAVFRLSVAPSMLAALIAALTDAGSGRILVSEAP
jgi:uncharacterized YigZ family protein